MTTIVRIDTGQTLSSKGKATTGRMTDRRNLMSFRFSDVDMIQTARMDEYEGYTKTQFMTALKAASRPMAERATNARAKGMAGKEESSRFLDDILNAGG